MTPQSGVEFLDLVGTGKFNLVVTDLTGNPLWTYDPGNTVPPGSTLGPFKLLPQRTYPSQFYVTLQQILNKSWLPDRSSGNARLRQMFTSSLKVNPSNTVFLLRDPDMASLFADSATLAKAPLSGP